MARGVTPRRPARTGRQDRVSRAVSSANVPKTTRSTDLRGAGAPAARQGAAKAKKTKTAAYNPIAPDRVAEILKRLDQLYPDVTCRHSQPM